jgi:hypothetical protein
MIINGSRVELWTLTLWSLCFDEFYGDLKVVVIPKIVRAHEMERKCHLWPRPCLCYIKVTCQVLKHL